MPKLYDNWPFFGGLDINTPYLSRKPGSLLRSLNYFPDPDGGYQHAKGYERFDGQPSPSDSETYSVSVDQLITPTPTLGDVLTSSSGGTAVFISQADNYVNVINITGTIADGDTIEGSTINDDVYLTRLIFDYAQWVSIYKIAREYLRDQILVVPGDGPVRAAYEHASEVYAIRDNGVDGAIYKATPTGWELVDLSTSFSIKFKDGNGASSDPFAIGDIIRGMTSDATAEVVGINIQSADRQSGSLGVKTLTGTFVDGEEIVIDNGNMQIKYKDAYSPDSFEPGKEIKGATSGATAKVIRNTRVSEDEKSGVLVLDDITGTFVDNEGITSGDDYKQLSYTGAIKSSPLAKGQTIKGKTSGATCIVFDIINVSGDEKSGVIVTLSIDGTFQLNEPLNIESGYSSLNYDGKIANTPAFKPGDIITGKTSGAFGIVIDAITTNTTSGTLILSGNPSGFTNDELIVVGTTDIASVNQVAYPTTAGTVSALQQDLILATTDGTVTKEILAVVDGDPIQVKLKPGGKYELVSHNFYGGIDTYNIYMVNGEQPAIQFTGSAITEIYSGNDNDKPNLIAVNHEHLFLTFDSSLQHSSKGEPLNWRGELGATELALGATITNLIAAAKALIVTSIQNIQVLYGESIANWQVSHISSESVGVPGSGQFMSRPLVIDRSGLIALDMVDAYGNFFDSVISDSIQKIMNRLAPLVTTSMVNKFNNHYVMFTSTGENILAGFNNNQFIGYFPFNLDISVTYCSMNERRMFICANDGGYVYEWQKGTSYDGNAFVSVFQTTYAFQQAPQRKKRYRRATITLKSFVPVALKVAYQFSKGNADRPPTTMNVQSLGGGGAWDFDNWGEILWDGQDVPELISDMEGVGTDVSMILYSESSELPDFVVEDITFEYSPRGIKR